MKFETFEPTQTQLRVLEAADRAGNLCAVFRLQGNLDEFKLKEAIAEVVRRAKPFSYRFLRVNEALQIFVADDASDAADTLRVVDISASGGVGSSVGEPGGESHMYSLIRNYCEREFRLDGGAPYLFVLLKRGETKHLVFVCHPAVMDRFSLKPLFAAISEYYSRGQLGSEGGPSLGLPQDELIASEQSLLTGPRYDESLRFWLEIVRETSFEWRPPRVDGEPADNYFLMSIDENLKASLLQTAESLGLSLERLLLFSFHIFLSRTTRNETVLTSYCRRISSMSLGHPTVAVPAANRRIGFNENKIALKSVFEIPQESVDEYFQKANRLLSQTEFHSDLPAREVAKELTRLESEFKRATNVAFAEDPFPYREFSLDGVVVTALPMFSHHLDVEDVSVFFDHSSRDGIHFHVMTRAAQEAVGTRIAFEHYVALLENLAEDIRKPLATVRMFNPTLRRKALELADGGPLKARPPDILTRLSELAATQPQAPALRCQDRSLTYIEFFDSARRVAGHVEHCLEQGLVGICVARSERMIQAIFGILLGGAGYVPLDPQMPAERLAYIAKDANLAAVIVDSKSKIQLELLLKCPLLDIEDVLRTPSRELSGGPRPQRPQPQDPKRIAYVIYTSGTTGKPKGVVLEYGNLAHFLASLEGVWDRGPGSHWLQFASITFDASVLEIFSPLVYGGELVVAPSESRTDPEAVVRLLQEAKVSHACLPPALLTLLPRRALPDLKAVYCGGEAIDEEAARFWSKAVALYNCYGPTEATVMATLNKLEGYKASNNIGRPMAGYQTYVLQDDGALTPVGGVGEICIGGAAVAREYLGRADLTAQRFIANPLGEGRLYRTGDLARFLPNGDLEFLGRSDFQVKIRGFRIELGEIEAAIATHPEVNGAYVSVMTREGNKSLVAWYVSTSLTSARLRETLVQKLPHYMVPSFLLRVEGLPLTINGKIDRARLPDPAQQMETVGSENFDELQSQIRGLWAAILKVSPQAVTLRSNFFHLGGHSLLAAIVCNRLNAAGTHVRPKALFEFPVLVDFCEHVRDLPQDAQPIAPLVAMGLRSARVDSRLIGLIHSRAMSVANDNMYNVVTRIDFSRQTDPQILRKALIGLLAANPIFRSSFREIDSHIVVEATAAPSGGGIPDLSIREGTEADISRRVEQMRLESFSLAHPPLWQAEIFVTPAKTPCLLFNIHHAIFDGWSLNLMMEELGQRYDVLLAGQSYSRQRLTWFDHCEWSRELPKTQLFEQSIAYWRKKLKGVNARCELPLDKNQKQPNSNAFVRVRFRPETVHELKKFADKKGLTLPPVLFSLYLIWLWRISNQEEIVCGYPYAGRDAPGTEEIFGTLVTMGFLRAQIQSGQSFSELATSVHRQMVEDRENLVAAPYDAEIANMDSLNVIFSLQSGIGLEGMFASGATFSAEELPSLTSKGDVAGVFYQVKAGAIEGRIEFDSSRISTEIMEGFCENFVALVESAAKNPEHRVGELQYLSQAELKEFLDLATGPVLAQQNQSIPERFSQIVARHSTKPAVIFGKKSLTYAELDQWSRQMAGLLTNHGLKHGLVGLAMQKGDAAIAAILGVLQSGNGYVPLDPGYPVERLRYFVENCGVTHVICDRESQAALTAADLGHLNFIAAASLGKLGEETSRAVPADVVAPSSLAYIIHTSGSTGKPKGVMVTHQTVVKLIGGCESAMAYGADDSSPLIGSFSFDTSVLEIFLPLLTGGTLHVVPEVARKDPTELHRVIESAGVSHVILSPVMLQNMPRKPLPKIRFLGFGGDTIDEATAEWWSKQTRLFSLYGPTETTVQASVGQILPGENPHIIGRPMPGYRIYLLNRRKQAVPRGAIGEICIGGQGLALGYLNRDELTMEKFVIDPFGGSPYAQMYLTGDLGRYFNDGTIEFFGRNDTQVKLRGFRIELGEIENRLSLFPGVEHVVCAAQGAGENKYLAAYYVATEDLNEDEVRKHLAKFLPEYMIPTFFVRLKTLPASVNGKIDRRALPTISGRVSKNPPREGVERLMADIWEEVLHFKGLGRDDNFFHFGGNSLLAVRMQAEVRRRMGMDLSIAEIYGAPTIEQLASGAAQRDIDSAVRDAREKVEAPVPEPGPALAPGPGAAASGAGLADRPVRHVLLTGAAGFLGVFLLDELCRRDKMDKVFCLVRGADDTQALNALLRNAKAAGREIDPSRFQVVRGDLAADGLGLSAEVRSELAASVDLIVHCGAFVHHMLSYRSLRDANVESTRELLKLALEVKAKAFTFVSTLTVGFATEGAREAGEVIVPNAPVINSGYILSKWVGEQLSAQVARQFGLSVLIARPGNITGATSTGYTNYANNHFWLFNKGCLQLGAYPDVNDIKVEMMPVDVLAKAIVDMSLNLPRLAKGEPLVANLSNPRTLDFRQFFGAFERYGFPAKATPVADWQRLLETVPEDNGLATIRGFYTGDLSAPQPGVQQTATLKALSEVGGRLDVEYDTFFPIYVDYLLKAGFLRLQAVSSSKL